MKEKILSAQYFSLQTSIPPLERFYKLDPVHVTRLPSRTQKKRYLAAGPHEKTNLQPVGGTGRSGKRGIAHAGSRLAECQFPFFVDAGMDSPRFTVMAVSSPPSNAQRNAKAATTAALGRRRRPRNFHALFRMARLSALTYAPRVHDCGPSVPFAHMCGNMRPSA